MPNRHELEAKLKDLEREHQVLENQYERDEPLYRAASRKNNDSAEAERIGKRIEEWDRQMNANETEQDAVRLDLELPVKAHEKRSVRKI